MEQPNVHRCGTCPAFAGLEGEGGSGTCRANPPTVFPDKEMFRGSSRTPLFGSYPSVGVFPIVHEADFCMAHPKNRKDIWDV
jgi:hypothetical protein